MTDRDPVAFAALVRNDAGVQRIADDRRSGPFLDGRFMHSAYSGPINPLVLWHAIDGRMPDGRRLAQAALGFAPAGTAGHPMKDHLLSTAIEGVYVTLQPSAVDVDRLGHMLSPEILASITAETHELRQANGPGFHFGPTERAVTDAIRDALTILHEAYAALPIEIGDGLDAEQAAERDRTLDALATAAHEQVWWGDVPPTAPGP